MSALSAVALVGFRGGDPAGDAAVVEVIEVRRTSPFDAAIRGAAGYDGEDGEQQHVGQLGELSLPGADQERPPARPTTARTRPRQPPSQLPPQSSDICRLGNPSCDQPPHFAHQVLQGRLSDDKTTALNSPVVAVDPLPPPVVRVALSVVIARQPRSGRLTYFGFLATLDDQAVSRNLRSSRSRLARPYIWRLSVFSRLMCPSVWPLLQASAIAACTAA